MSYRLILQNCASGRPVLEGLASGVAQNGGLTPDEAALLGQACGEVFSFLCQGAEEIELEWVFRGHASFAEAQLWLPARPRAWQALQACQLSGLLREFSRERLLPAADLQPGQTSLMRAARAVEQVNLRAQDRRVGLCLRKDRYYPELDPPRWPAPPPQEVLRIDQPTPAGLQDFCSFLPDRHWGAPIFLRHPQRVSDLMASDGLCGVLAYGLQDRCLGGMFWWPKGRNIRGYGPYLMEGQSKLVAEQLLDACLRASARTAAYGLSILEPTLDLPVGQFERLGSYTLRDKTGRHEVPAYFRQLHEDPGGAAWCPEFLEDWLRQEYDRLELGREIRPLPTESTAPSPLSAFSTELQAGRLILQPIHPGDDSTECLERYVKAALEAGVVNIFVTLDLGQPWQGALAQVLRNLHFKPCFLRPAGGENLDLLIWQYESADA